MANRCGIILSPERAFIRHKALAWLLIGPLNPMWWGAALVCEVLWQTGAFVGFLTLAPSSLGGFIVLARLRNSKWLPRELDKFVNNWAGATIFIYLGVVIVIASVLYLGTANPSIDAIIMMTAAMFGGFFIACPFAVVLGAIPAWTSAKMTRLIVKRMVFEEMSSNRQPAMR